MCSSLDLSGELGIARPCSTEAGVGVTRIGRTDIGQARARPCSSRSFIAIRSPTATTTRSFGNHALFRTIVAALESRGHQVVATDLYREGFEPAMRAEERSSYFQAAYDESAVSAHADLLRRVDGIVFCFPH